jgi:hypothetical protein
VEWGEGGLPWTTHLDTFVTFLSEYYGYDIYSEVAIRRSPMREKGTWKGQYFGVATDLEVKMQQQIESDFDETDFGNYGGTSD